MNDIFNAEICGTVYKNAIIKQTVNGKEYVTFSIITESSFKDKVVKQYHNMKAWGGLVESVSFLKEGDRVHVGGTIDNGSYKDKKTDQWVKSNSINLIEVFNITKAVSSPQQENQNHPQSNFDDEIPF